MKKLIPIFLFFVIINNINAQTSDKNYAIKYDFFSPVAGCFGFAFEKPKSNFTSLDIEAGLIGLKLGDYYLHEKFGGGYLAVGPRLYFNKDDADKNDFKGPYFKPEVLLNYFQYNYQTYYYNYIDGIEYLGNIDGSDFSASLLLCMGNQWILSDLIVFDLWFGLGYGGDWISEKTDVPPDFYQEQNKFYKYSHIHFGDSPMVFDGGLSIGMLF